MMNVNVMVVVDSGTLIPGAGTRRSVGVHCSQMRRMRMMRGRRRTTEVQLVIEMMMMMMMMMKRWCSPFVRFRGEREEGKR